MDKKRAFKFFLPLGGTFSLLLEAIVFDWLFQVIIYGMSDPSGAQPSWFAIWLFPLLELVWMAGGLGLFWFLITSEESSLLVGVILFILGLVLVVTASLIFTSSAFSFAYPIATFLVPGTFTHQASIVLTLIGGFSLLLSRRKKPLQEEGGLTLEQEEQSSE